MNVTGELIGEDRSPKFRWGVGGGWIVCQDVVFFFLDTSWYGKNRIKTKRIFACSG